MSTRITPIFTARPATPDDRPRLYEIHRAAMGPYVTELWGWNDGWQAEAFAKSFDPGSTRVIVVDKEVVGFFQTHEDTEAVVIELDPAFQRRGIGTSVITGMPAEARARAKPVRLQVFKINPRARSLYHRLGFLETGETSKRLQMAAPIGT